MNYKTTEQVVGTWIDGSVLYRKVVDFGILPNNGRKSVSTGISGQVIFRKVTGIAYELSSPYPPVAKPDGYCFPLSVARPDNAQGAIGLYMNGRDIEIVTGADRTSYGAYVFLEYTKRN